LADAIGHARHGSVVSRSQTQLTAQKLDQLQDVPGFAETYLQDGQVPAEGSLLRQPRLAATLEQLAERGLDDFYRGELARSMASELEQLGSPLRLSDLHNYHAQLVTPLSVRLQDATIFNLPPPTQDRK